MKAQDLIKEANAKQALQMFGWYKKKKYWTDGKKKMSDKEFKALCTHIDNTSEKTGFPATLVIGIIIGM